jgi:AcrR family transcriptional regulator
MSKKHTIDPRVKRTRKLILDAFISLMGEKPFDSITIADIAARATVNRATFYSHFEDKNKLVAYMIGEQLQMKLDEKLSSVITLDEENFRLLVITIGEYLNEFHGHCLTTSHKQIESFIETEMQQRIYAKLLSWIRESGKTPSGSSPEMAATVLSWSILGTTMQWSQSEKKQSLSELASSVMALLVGGLASFTKEKKPLLAKWLS